LATFIRDYEPLLSQIFISHVRDASKGKHTLQNTHPFQRAFRSFDVVFAHNGTLKPPLESSELKFLPVGETDSENLFCALLTTLSESNIQFVDFQNIESLLRKFNSFGTMNLLFSEGEHLFSYKDKDSHNGLWITERISSFGIVSLKDEDWEIDLAEEKHPDQRGFMIASHPLTKNEKWIDLIPGSLVVLKNGCKVYGT